MLITVVIVVIMIVMIILIAMVTYLMMRIPRHEVDDMVHCACEDKTTKQKHMRRKIQSKYIKKILQPKS